MAVWLPDARRNLGQHAGDFTSRVTIGVIHTTESSTFTPGDSYYGRNVWPHFTFIPGDHSYTNAVWQHLPLDKAARALANRAGGVETNREGCIQIEVVAFAARPGWSQGGSQTVWNFRRLMAEIEANTFIPHRCDVVFGGNEQYGLDNGYELSNFEWESYAGWLGHQHVPENAHWDPGEIDIANLLLEQSAATGDDMHLNDEGPHVKMLQHRLAKLLTRDLAVDGVYGPSTAKAVGDAHERLSFRRVEDVACGMFQAKLLLVVDGQWGEWNLTTDRVERQNERLLGLERQHREAGAEGAVEHVPHIHPMEPEPTPEPAS